MRYFLKSLICSAALFVLTSRISGGAESAELAKFFRGLNLNGPALTIDGNEWEGKDSKTYACNGNAFENQAVVLKPSTDARRAQMIRSSRWGRSIDVELQDIPAGDYQLFLYVWEDNDSTRFEILLNDKTVIKQFDSGAGGSWRKLGPWLVSPANGKIKLSARGGDANLSGIEIWSGRGEIPKPPGREFVAASTPEQVDFFERKIRPVLADHCYQCHSAGAEKLGGGLLLDSRIGIIKGGDSEPPIVPGDPNASLLMTAIRHTDASLKMPPKKKLAEMQIEDLAAWIRMGAPDPRTADTTAHVKSKYTIDWDKAREFWSLKPVRQPNVPAVRDTAWPRSDLDRFILSRLEANRLSPVPDADRKTLIRRATYDLIGLPPTPQEIDAFEKDQDSNAFATVVDRLLASPQYGERWGRHWLDVVRYADTAGDNSDFPIPQMYLYRNWVIDAVNRDLPYDRFVREQLAGDLLPAADEASRRKQTIATGYIANARRFGSRVDDYPQHLTIEDTIDNLGRAFLGTTINCARCHDHKFDPISTQDYYALYGIFHSTRYPWPGIELEQKQRDLVPLVPAAAAATAQAAKRTEQERLDAEVRRLEKERDAAQGEDRKRLDKAVQEARNVAERHSKSPLGFEVAYAVADAAHVEDVRVQQKGDPAKTGPLVHRHFLTVLGGAELPTDDRTSGRLRLADWIVSPENPLAARVMVNRLWRYHFGTGIVPTPNDFGRQGKPPTHPELLDWLASRFVESGWSIKVMHRLIMLSRVYRLAGSPSPDALLRDPNNEGLSYFPRRRLDAEAIRDTLLVLGGSLDPTPGGPHPFPPQAEWKFTQHNPFKAVYETNRRSVYLMTQRIQRHPYLSIFDGADPSISIGTRPTSTTPLQALYLLNDPLVHEQSARFAARLLDLAPDDSRRFEQAYLLAVGRRPGSDETDAALKFLEAVRTELRAGGVPADQVDREAWQSAVRAIFRLNEFVYVD
jgi:hypothetical protein